MNRFIALLLLCAPLCACDAASPRLADSAPVSWTDSSKRVVLATPDIELSELTAGGANAPRADWTASAIADLSDAQLQPLWELGADIALLGAGERQEFAAARIRAAFRSRGMALECMSLGAACRTYNILASEARSVVAGLFP